MGLRKDQDSRAPKGHVSSSGWDQQQRLLHVGCKEATIGEKGAVYKQIKKSLHFQRSDQYPLTFTHELRHRKPHLMCYIFLKLSVVV